MVMRTGGVVTIWNITDQMCPSGTANSGTANSEWSSSGRTRHNGRSVCHWGGRRDNWRSWRSWRSWSSKTNGNQSRKIIRSSFFSFVGCQQFIVGYFIDLTTNRTFDSLFAVNITITSSVFYRSSTSKTEAVTTRQDLYRLNHLTKRLQTHRTI